MELSYVFKTIPFDGSYILGQLLSHLSFSGGNTLDFVSSIFPPWGPINTDFFVCSHSVWYSYFLVFFDNDFDDFEMNLLVSLLTPWFYIWFVAIVVMIVLSCTLGEGEYSLAAGTSVPTQNGVFCPSCGAMNSSASGFCSKCGATLSNQEAPIVCSNCGRKLTATDAFCPGCGTARK